MKPLPRPAALALAATALSSLLASFPGAQIASCLAREGDPLAGAPLGETISSISNTAVNQLGGYAATINTTDGTDTFSNVWGSATGGPGGLLQTEGTIGTLQQTSFESFFGVSDSGMAAYSATCTDTITGTTGLDSVWLGGTVVALEGDPIAGLPGKMWRFASRPGTTGDGQPYWVGGINDITTGADEGRGLFLGLGATALLKTGDLVPPLAFPVDPSGIDFDARVSALGNHYISGIDTNESFAADNYVVIDGTVLSLGGDLVGESRPVDASIGGLVGELWDNFDFLGITETGEYMFTGDTDATAGEDEFILRNGMIEFREGETVDGRVLTGFIEGASMNEAGEIAYIWDVVDPLGGSLEALFFEDKLLLVEGDEVDLDGDGALDAGATISSFTGLTAVTLGADRSIYFTADIDTLGTSTTSDDVECFFCLPVGTLVANTQRLSLSAGGTANLNLLAGVANAGRVYLMLGSVSGTSPGIGVNALVLPLNFDAYLQFTAGTPNTPPLLNGFAILDADGEGQAQFALPPGTTPALAGLDASHAYLLFDLATLQADFVSNAVSIELAP